MKKKTVWKLVGHVGVDAGLISIGDPCYNAAKKAQINNWSKYVDKMHTNETKIKGLYKMPFRLGHEGEAIIAQTLHGDGMYPVFVSLTPDGKVEQMKIKFD
jgi:hypothetical protein